MKRSKHSLSHYHLTTGKMGELIPLTWQEALPGDTWQQSTSALIRLSPVMAPVMHPVQVRIHHFYVPMRLLDNNWENFITGKSSTPPPKVSLSPDRLSDFLGLPIDAPATLKHDVAPIKAYNMIFNEYYRDQDLVPEVPLTTSSVQKISWEKDYFTSARPWPQKGEAVTIPIGDSAPIKGLGLDGVSYNLSNETAYETGGTVDGAPAIAQYAKATNVTTGSNPLMVEEDEFNSGYPAIYADLSRATAVDVNDFRKAFAMQRYNEARARYGSRYTEYLRYLGITPSDARLQRPEYLGGGKQTISFSEVLQTAPGQDSVVGEMKGHGISAVRTNKFRRFFEEHGIVMTMMSVRPKAIYRDGLHRKWSRMTKEDYYQKELELIGQQEILNKEIYAVGNSSDDEVFGYADRYREYREHPSYVTRDFRNVLDHWHLAREFSGQPVLNSDFIKCLPSLRIFADQTSDPLWIMTNHSIQARRMVRKNPTSRII